MMPFENSAKPYAIRNIHKTNEDGKDTEYLLYQLMLEKHFVDKKEIESTKCWEDASN